MPSPCKSCARPIGDMAVRCPHCGEVQTDRDPRLKEPEKKVVRDLTPEEARALLEVKGVDGRPKGFWNVFLRPHYRARGALRTVDQILIAFTLPLAAGILSGIFFRLGNRRGVHRTQPRAETPRAETLIFETVLTGLLGGLVLVTLGWQIDMLWPALALALVGTLALLARIGIRLRLEK